MGSSTSYRRAPGETTEWEDILVAKGIVAPKVDPEEAKRQAALEDAIERKMAAFDPLADKSAAELDALEEEDGEYADSRVLERYRRARLEELKAKAAANRFGALFPLSRPDFVKEVTEASRAAPVVVLLYKDAIAESRLLEAVMLRLAAKHRTTKFMKIVAESCIEGYPGACVRAGLGQERGGGMLVALAGRLFPAPPPARYTARARRVPRAAHRGTRIMCSPLLLTPALSFAPQPAQTATCPRCSTTRAARSRAASWAWPPWVASRCRTNVSPSGGVLRGGRFCSEGFCVPAAAPTPSRPPSSRAAVEWALSRMGAVQTELEEDPLAAGGGGSSGRAGVSSVSRPGGRALSSRGRYDSEEDEDR